MDKFKFISKKDEAYETKRIEYFLFVRYITDHQCNSTGTQSELREAKLSFPSGHSSYATYAFVFLFVNIVFFLSISKSLFLRFISKHVLFVRISNFSSQFFNVYAQQSHFLLVYHVLPITNIMRPTSSVVLSSVFVLPFLP